ncbi:MAG: DUF2125 domain-containing protein [Pseudomonadota bacterium]
MSRAVTTTASTLALSMLVTPGWSLTAEETWQNWQSQIEASGQSVTVANESSSGGVLTLEGVSLSAEMPEANITGALDTVTFTENADGTVSVVFAPEYELTITANPELGEDFSAVVAIRQPGSEIIASDIETAIRYSIAAPTVEVELKEFTGAEPDVEISVTATGSDVSGSYSVSKAEPVELVTDITVGKLEIGMEGGDPVSEFSVNGEMQTFTVQSTSINGTMFGVTDLSEALDRGLAGSGTASYGPTMFNIDFEDSSESFEMDLASQGGSSAFEISADQLSYEIIYNALEFAMSSSDLPFPKAEAAFNSLTTNVQMPMKPTDDARPFRLKLDMDQFTLADPIWNLFDPAAVLPRDPAKILIDLSGTGRWLIDIFDPETVPNDVPGEVETVELSDLLLQLAGAELSGAGSFTLDNTDLQTFQGMPRPAGSANFTLIGANALLDKLVQMGLVPQEQAMGARMMSGMAFRPGEGEDTLVSEIVVEPNGQVTANGNIIVPGR